MTTECHTHNFINYKCKWIAHLIEKRNAHVKISPNVKVGIEKHHWKTATDCQVLPTTIHTNNSAPRLTIHLSLLQVISKQLNDELVSKANLFINTNWKKNILPHYRECIFPAKL